MRKLESKYEKKFFNLLIDNWNFYIKDYESKNSLKYVAIKEEESYIYCVIISDFNDYKLDYIKAKEMLEKIFDKKVIVNVVIFKSDKLNENNIKDDYANYHDNFNKIIYSLDDKKVVYSSKSCELLIPIFKFIQKEKANKKKYFKQHSITLLIIAVNIILYLICAFKSKSIYYIDIDTLIDMGAKVNLLIDNGQVFRILTSAFLHGGIVHLFFNMYAFYSVGSQIEVLYGEYKFVTIYILSAIGGSIFSYMFNSKSVSVGASGAIFGLFGAMLVFAFKNKINKSYIISLVQVIVANIIIGLTLSNIDNYAHFGGFIFGIIFSVLLIIEIKNEVRTGGK